MNNPGLIYFVLLQIREEVAKKVNGKQDFSMFTPTIYTVVSGATEYYVVNTYCVKVRIFNNVSVVLKNPCSQWRCLSFLCYCVLISNVRVLKLSCLVFYLLVQRFKSTLCAKLSLNSLSEREMIRNHLLI